MVRTRRLAPLHPPAAMAASAATSSVATRPSSCPRLPDAPLRALRPAAVSFPLPPSPRLAALVAGARRPVMAAAAAVHQRLMGSLNNTEWLRFGVVVARFNEIVTNLLLQGALETFEPYSVKVENITMPTPCNRRMQSPWRRSSTTRSCRG